ncbi:MAG TPA: urease accessory UreF family protein [Acidisoma sp.]|jgi:urease accessory protein|nr:urease accessory UreF family protein [Acidisoma sp.]
MMTTMITTMTIARPDLSEAGFLRLLTWLSPAFPTGGFAYSHGIEWAVETGDARSIAGIVAWIVDILEEGSGRNDAILLRHAHRAAAKDDATALLDVVELAAAIPGCRERYLEATAQGNAFLAAAAAWPCSILDALAGHDVAYPVAVGAVAAAHGVDEDRAVLGFLHTFAANLVSAAIRIIPLGQQQGLRILSALEPVLVAVANDSRDLTLDEIGSGAIRADLAAMHHETQYTRLFRT